MIGNLLFVSSVTLVASQECKFPTVYKSKSYDGCTTVGHDAAWCYTDTDLSGDDWRDCTIADHACVFPFTYQEKEYNECTSVDADEPWCAVVGGGWKNCGAKKEPPAQPKGQLGKKSGADGWVADHNHFRAKHGADPVTWDSDLAAKAEKWANKLKDKDSMFHSDCYAGTGDMWPASGENLAWGYGACNPAVGDGGPALYTNDDYDQHCAVASWYGEYYLWRGSGNWQQAQGIGHFTAIVWKGVDAIGCAQAGKYFVCEYGSKQCKAHEKYGGSDCWSSNPSHLPNFNSGTCSGGACIQDLFTVAGFELEDKPIGIAGMSAFGAGVLLFAASTALVVRRLRAHACERLAFGDEEFCPVSALQEENDE